MFKEKLLEIYNKLLGSLDNKKDSGFSARKLTSLTTMLMIIGVHISWLKYAFIKEDFEYLTEVLMIDELFILLLLGIITLEQVSNFKNEIKKESNNEKEEL